MLEKDLIDRLTLAIPSVAGRVHLGNAPQDTALPFAVLRRTAGSTPRTLGGVKLFGRANVSVDLVGATYADVLIASAAAHESLDGFKGQAGETYVESARCLSDPADNSLVDGDLVLRQLTQDFLVVYREL
jgi:hypothetical protein